jgi:hypothetical protein
MGKKSNSLKDVFIYINLHDGDASVCWEWTRPCKDRPYFTVQGEKLLSYRIVFELVHGPLAEGELVRHTCDNPICCNPYHLVRGTHEDNMEDVKERDRHGMPSHVVRAIRKLLAEGRTQDDIASLYGISRKTVSAIKTGRTKSHVGDDDDGNDT